MLAWPAGLWRMLVFFLLRSDVFLIAFVQLGHLDDAQTINWADFDLVYAFPPFSVVGRVLQKIVTDQATAIVILPKWPSQPWFTRLCQLLAEPPVEIKVTADTLHLPHDTTKTHPMAGTLRLWACKLCTNCTRDKEYHPRPLR